MEQHETFEHPIACINVCSTENTDPIEALKGLFNWKSLEFSKNLVDPEIVQYYILVHDQQNQEIDRKKYDSNI